MFPDRSHAAIDEKDRGDPPLRTVNLRPVFHEHEVLPLLMTEQKRVEIWQEADQWALKLGLRQFIEILPKDGRLPALHANRREIGLLARKTCPDFTGLCECYARP
jgi:hypothetical protein